MRPLLACLAALILPSLACGFADAHVHLNDLDAVLAMMRAHGIERAVVFWGHRSDNAEVRLAAAVRPGLLVPFLSVSPEREEPYGRWWRTGDRQLLAYVERELAGGASRGLGELSIVHFPSQGFPETEHSPLHPLMVGLMETAEKRDLPVMLHCEMTYARALDQLMARFPGVRVVWAHGGYAPLYWTERMLERHARLTVDLSMRAVEDHPRSPDYWILKDAQHVWPRWLELIEANPDRFVVGTDAAQRSSAADAARAASIARLLDQLTPATRERVARLNLEALLAPSAAAAPVKRARKMRRKAHVR